MIRLQIKLRLKQKAEELPALISKELKEDVEDLSFEIVKRSLDARDKSNIFWLYTVDVDLRSEKKEEKCIGRSKGKITKVSKTGYSFEPKGTVKMDLRPVVVGCGPAGLFAAYMLAKNGYRPIVLERGEDVDARQKTVESFWAGNSLDPNSNVQFGEGGAGTFSDGKLNTGVKDPMGRIGFVLETFVQHGADPEIRYVNKPHIGTDELKKVVKNMRNEAIANGAEFRFNCCVTDVESDKEGALSAVVVNGNEKIPCNICILAIGHSSRDTFDVLSKKKLTMTPKAFAIGLRMEHLQEVIGFSQYGNSFKDLPAADYKMTYSAKDGRGVYSFCMCPGGFVVNASSEEGKTCVNGMSNHARNEKNANSAIVVQVNPEDFAREGFEGVLAGMRFQQKWEENCFKVGGGKIPVQRFEDFKNGKETVEFGSVLPNSKGLYVKSDLSPCLPKYVKEDIIEAVMGFDAKLKGFAEGDAILSGVETRTSSPVRIERNDNGESDIPGLYPCGEGAGYAGGITSAAVDGIKIFEMIATKYERPTND
ncbi:MAG: FAD-dependent oxidoreductase [Lachnospiraceae bacterium]|nr:FAD-dependent oxidoreductase [Lachnospiraceae bacterium]